MRKIAFLCPYFGKYPNHFELFLKSCKENKNCTWFIFTDDKSKHDYPQNVQITYMTLQEIQKKFSDKLGFDCALPNIKKLGDYKPLLGFMFEDYIKEYKAWGHIDLNDSIYGDIDHFLTDEILDKYNKIMCLGHMSIYKNTYENNRMFQKTLKNGMDYKTIFKDDTFYNFEEISENSITKIYLENDEKIKNMCASYADIGFRHYNFELGQVKDDYSSFFLSKERNMVFAWEKGKLYQYKIVNKNVQKKEFLYIHIKRRKLTTKGDIQKEGIEKFIIYQDGFMPYEKITPRFIKKHDKKTLVYIPFWRERYKNLIVKIKKKIGIY